MNRTAIIIGAVLFVLIIALVIPKGGNGNNPEVVQEAETVQEKQQQAVAQKIYDQAVAFKKDGQIQKTKELYQTLMAQHSDFEQIEVIQTELEAINMQMVFSSTPSSYSEIHEVVSGDTLGKLAQHYGTTIELIKIRNNLKNNTIRIGQKLSIWTGRFNIFVDKSQNILFLKAGDEILKVYHVSTGVNNSTPVGEFKIISKLVDPVWFNKGVVVPPESPANALGSRWLGFDTPGYGIHGTIEPDNIGKQITAGCVRMRNVEVENLYSVIPLGTKVTIVD